MTNDINIILVYNFNDIQMAEQGHLKPYYQYIPMTMDPYWSKEEIEDIKKSKKCRSQFDTMRSKI